MGVHHIRGGWENIRVNRMISWVVCKLDVILIVSSGSGNGGMMRGSGSGSGSGSRRG